MIHSKTLQIGKNQDEVFQGEAIDSNTGENYAYGIIADGHGDKIGFNYIRSILQKNVATILEHQNPHLFIQDQIEALVQSSIFASYAETKIIDQLEQSGSTFIRVKIYADRVECFSIGDSEIYVLKNGEIAYHNHIHVWENDAERTRLLNREDIQVRTKPCMRYNLVNPNTLIEAPCTQIFYTNDHLFVPSQCLGHDGITQFAPERQTIEYGPGDRIKVILASDGLWDVFMPSHPEDFENMKTMNGEELADVAEMRWKQSWYIAKSPETPEDLFPDTSEYDSSSYDDIAVITICSSNYSHDADDNT